MDLKLTEYRNFIFEINTFKISAGVEPRPSKAHYTAGAIAPLHIP
jgi:hypothetical protein